MRSRKGAASLGFLPVPRGLPPFLSMPGDPGRFIRMETVLLHYAPALFGEYKLQQFRVQVQVRIPGDAQDAAALQLVLPKPSAFRPTGPVGRRICKNQPA